MWSRLLHAMCETLWLRVLKGFSNHEWIHRVGEIFYHIWCEVGTGYYLRRISKFCEWIPRILMRDLVVLSHSYTFLFPIKIFMKWVPERIIIRSCIHALPLVHKKLELMMQGWALLGSWMRDGLLSPTKWKWTYLGNGFRKRLCRVL